MAAKLRCVSQHLGMVSLGDTRVRIARILLEYGRSVVPLTHHLLAEMAGCSRITVTRHLGELQERGVLRLGRGAITIRDRAALRSEGLIESDG